MSAAVTSRIRMVIANGTALSTTVNIGDAVPVGIDMPDGWTAADITVQASGVRDGELQDVHDLIGIEYTLVVAANQQVTIPPGDLASVVSLRLRSGTSGTPVNQGAERVLYLIVKAL